MDIETLRKLGGFVSPTPVEREVTWQPRNEEGEPQGEPVTFTVRIKRLSAGMSEDLFVKGDAKDDRAKYAALLSKTLFIGDDLISYEDAYQLDPTLQTEFAKHANKINGWGQDGAAAKNSQPSTNSGATS
jgi:hypothetical protein